MVKAKIQKNEEDEDNISPQQQIASFLKANKQDHYNFEEDNYYQVPSSSLSLMSAMDGGISPGAHRATGVTTGGKTSCTLDFMHHFLSKGAGHRGVYVKAEGRLSPEMRSRSGISFVGDPEKWEDGTCFVLETNVYEAVFGFIGELIRNNPTKTKYFFIIDSLDMMAKRDDLAKPLEEAGQVAGGALITSVFLKKTSAALSKRGHFCWFISQVRDSIKINPYEKSAPRQGGASGGHAVEHAGDYVLEFLPRYNDDLIRENPSDKNSKPIGHYCKLRIVKSNNEKYGVEVRYPIKYGRSNASSVWVEREIIDLLLSWEQIERKGAWFKMSAALRSEIESNTGVQIPEQIQGIDNVYKVLEENKSATSYLFEKLRKISSNK